MALDFERFNESRLHMAFKILVVDFVIQLQNMRYEMAIVMTVDKNTVARTEY